MANTEQLTDHEGLELEIFISRFYLSVLIAIYQNIQFILLTPPLFHDTIAISLQICMWYVTDIRKWQWFKKEACEQIVKKAWNKRKSLKVLKMDENTSKQLEFRQKHENSHAWKKERTCFSSFFKVSKRPFLMPHTHTHPIHHVYHIPALLTHASYYNTIYTMLGND